VHPLGESNGEEVYNILMESAGDSTERLRSVQALVVSHSKRGGVEIAQVVEQGIQWEAMATRPSNAS
jgi:hypothetical protein